jgi:Leucine-rich repeat (LRR) protein
VAEVVLRCKTTNGVVEKRFNDDAEMVYVSRSTSRALSLTHTSSSLHLQLDGLGLTEVPFALFRMKNEELWLGNNNLCSLPSDIAHLARLERLYVRLLKRF